MATSLIKQLITKQRLDFVQDTTQADPRCRTDSLFGDARGKMFGVLECLRPDGSTTSIKAFSGQYNGLWFIPGWAPPLFNVKRWISINDPIEKEIKKLGERISSLSKQSELRKTFIKSRRDLSRELMKQLHDLYKIRSFTGTSQTLSSFFPENSGIPNGTGDCCAPKLLNYALLNNYIPTGISEFYFGKTNKSHSRFHGKIYPSCTEKCAPILGFMLCGLDIKRVKIRK
ncbi:MAG: hypothetical protein GY705_20190 [Bacteroidetes bacterium]|nr:hypothetical protein [Bacteroidota bacterium]